MIDKGCAVLHSAYIVICKDVFWSLNFVHLSSLSYYGFSFLQPSLRDQPSWRLWNEPASDTHTTHTDFILHHITEVNFSYIIGFYSTDQWGVCRGETV